MSDRTFLDSNVLVYSVDESSAEKAKHERAVELIAAQPGNLVVSTQVLQEFYVVTTRKLKVPLSEERAARAVRGIATRPMGIHNGWREQRNSQATLPGWPPPPTR